MLRAAYDLENQPTSRQTFDASVSSRSMWEHYLPAFDACINEAKGMHVMCSYNSINGAGPCRPRQGMRGAPKTAAADIRLPHLCGSGIARPHSAQPVEL
jgi:hypothetical protein